MANEVWDEITEPSPSVNGCTVEVRELISNFNPHFITDVIYLSTLGLMLIRICKMGPRVATESPYDRVHHKKDGVTAASVVYRLDVEAFY